MSYHTLMTKCGNYELGIHQRCFYTNMWRVFFRTSTCLAMFGPDQGHYIQNGQGIVLTLSSCIYCLRKFASLTLYEYTNIYLTGTIPRKYRFPLNAYPCKAAFTGIITHLSHHQYIMFMYTGLSLVEKKINKNNTLIEQPHTVLYPYILAQRIQCAKAGEGRSLGNSAGNLRPYLWVPYGTQQFAGDMTWRVGQKAACDTGVPILYYTHHTGNTPGGGMHCLIILNQYFPQLPLIGNIDTKAI